jgi:hypothetical protein
VPLNDIQRETLLDILSHKRPYDTPSCRAFIATYVLTLPDAWADDWGNVHVTIGRADGRASRVLWSCHTDTVHRVGGKQAVYVSDDGIAWRGPRAVDCLGADDGAGVFIMREMIGAQIPGHYIFHNGEEKGGIGSSAIAWNAPDVLQDFDYAIAFDRRGTADIITHQCGGRTASRAFARSLARILNDGTGLKYAPSDRGIYTDTAEYAHVIPECTNVSVGYLYEHTADEQLDLVHMGRLLDVLMTFDEDKLICARDPRDNEPPPRSGQIRSGQIVSKQVGNQVFRFVSNRAESDLDETSYIDVELDDEGRPLGDDYYMGSDGMGIRPRVIDGICELCKWPERLCQCTDEDRRYWRYLNGYK